MSNLTEKVQGVSIGEGTRRLLKLYAELSDSTDSIGDVIEQVWSGEEYDFVMEPFVLAMDKAMDELTRLVALNMRANLTAYKAVI